MYYEDNKIVRCLSDIDDYKGKQYSFKIILVCPLYLEM